MNHRLFLLGISLLTGAASAETLTCPVGGEQFLAPAATACNAFTRQTMLLMPAGCPPDPLPQCPLNFLPMYKSFSAAELPVLKQYMQSESYESNVDFSPYYLAYIVEKHLNGPDKQLPALLLLRGLWQTPALITDDPEYIIALAYELEQNRTPATPEDNAMMLAMLGFVRLLQGEQEAGLGYLARAENQAAQTQKTRRYLAAVRACFNDLSAAHCRADALIP